MRITVNLPLGKTDKEREKNKEIGFHQECTEIQALQLYLNIKN
jgi:hypothetical protein